MAATAGRGQFVVIGGGAAGLAAAYELAGNGCTPIILEKTNSLGGLARTESYKGYLFDIGGHRFAAHCKAVEAAWRALLGDSLLHRQALSSIYYKGRLIHCPVEAGSAVRCLGLTESSRICLSWACAKLWPSLPEETIENYIANRFGRRLFDTLFKPYIEKVWGIPCSELQADWAAPRMDGLSLAATALNLFRRSAERSEPPADCFCYPRFGPGMMWQAMQRYVEDRGGAVRTDSEIVSIRRRGNHLDGVVVRHNGRQETVEGDGYLSSMPLADFVSRLTPPPSASVQSAAQRLRHRDFLTVCLIVRRSRLFPENWIYVPDPHLRVGRIQNFKNWSPDLVPDPDSTSLGLEYFCGEGDALWTMADADLIELGTTELDRSGLASRREVADGCVYRVPKAYPIHDADYRASRSLVRDFVMGLANVQMIGRNGLHQYDSLDHAMLTGMRAVRNLLHGEDTDLWSVMGATR